MAQPINELGSGGFNADTPPSILPFNTFSDVLNVRFDDNSVSTTTGETTLRTVSISPDYGIHWRRPDTSYNIFAKDGDIVRVDSSGVSSVMFAGGVGYASSDWQGTYFNGGYAVVLNNGTSTPIYCLYGDAVADATFQPLPNWNYLVGLTVTARVIRSLNYSLVAANLTLNQSGTYTYAPGTIRISTQAATGNIPQTWEPGTTTDTADEFELSSTSPILDMAELRGNMFVYSSDSISVLNIGATTRVTPYSRTYGILNTDCVVEYDGNHFVVDRNSIYTHNGSGKIEPLAEGIVKKWFFRNLNTDAISKVHVVKNSQYKEIWVCFPTGSNTYCDTAVIYQYFSKTWTKRSLPSVSYSFNCPANTSNTWQYGKERLALLTNSSQTLITDDVYTMWDGTALSPYESYVERKKINPGDPSFTSSIYKFLPIFDNVPDNAAITIRVVGQDSYTKDVDLSVPNNNNEWNILPTIDGNQSYKVDPRINGRLLNYRITSLDYWRLSSIYIDVTKVSGR
jgi:hypothetical protein